MLGSKAFPLVVAALIASLAAACTTDAETPNARFGQPGNAVPGDVNQPCVGGNACNEESLICIPAQGGEPATCRAPCETDEDDPCGVGFRCVALSGGTLTDGACIPAAALGETCGLCDDGLACFDDPDDPVAPNVCVCEDPPPATPAEGCT